MLIIASAGNTVIVTFVTSTPDAGGNLVLSLIINLYLQTISFTVQAVMVFFIIIIVVNSGNISDFAYVYPV